MKKTLALFLPLREWLFSNYKLLILSLVLACLSFPVFNLTYASGSGIDEPLPWVFNYFADGHYLLGKDIHFPHGPLAFLLYPLPMGNNVFAAIFTYLLCALVLCMSLFKIHASQGQEKYPLVMIALLLILALCELQLLVISITLCQLILFHLHSKRIHLLAALFFCMFGLYLKTYSGIVCCLLVASEFIYTLAVNKNSKRGLQMAGFFILFFFLFWLLLYGTFSGSFSFLWGQIQLSSDNSEAVSYYQENNWWLISLSLIAVVLVPVLSKDKLTRHSFFLMALPLFAAWKHAMARGEEHHITGFLNILLLLALILWIISNEKNILIPGLFIFSLVTFLLSLALKEGYAKQKNFELLKVWNLYHLVSDYDSIASEKNRTSVNSSLYQHLPDSILKLIGDKTADVFPWNYSYIAASHLNWQPRPVLHSYAAYTSWLDQQNAEHITSGNSAQFLIWEYTDTDYNGNKFDGIDSRYILNDEPKTLVNFFAHYTLKLKTPIYSLYEKNTRPLESSSMVSDFKKIRYNTWIEIPASQENTITRARLKISKSFAGALKSFFYKGEAFCMYYELENHKIYSNRIVPKNAADGIWLDPFILHPETNDTEPRIKKIKLVCLDQDMVNPEFEIAFEQIKFTSKNGGGSKDISIPGHCFGKTGTQAPDHVLFALNKTEALLNPECLPHDTSARKITTGSLSEPLCYALDPKKTTAQFSCKLDTVKITKDTHYLTFLVEAFVKAAKPVEGVMVISQNNQVKWSESIKASMMQNEDFWHYISFLRKVSVNEINLSEPFQFYILNAEKEEILYVDDFSVSVDGSRD